MADKPGRSSKKPFNPLLNVSVTGATLEEFTQNAILCPAAEPVVPPVLQTVPLNNQPEPDPPIQSINYSDNQQFNQSLQDHQQAYQLDSYNPQYSTASTQYPDPSYNQSSSSSSESTASTLLSSFSNILSFGSQIRTQSKKETLIDDPPGPNPNSVEHLLSATGSEQSVGSIPLYSASAHSVALSGPPLPPSSLAGPKLTASLTGPPLHGPPKSALSGHSVYSGPPPPLPAGNIPTYLSGTPPPPPRATPPKVPSPGLSGFTAPPFSEVSLPQSSLSEPFPQVSRSSHSPSFSKPPVPLPRSSPELSRTPVGLPAGPPLPPVDSSSVFPPSVPFFTPSGISADLSGPVGACSLSGPSIPPVVSSAPVFPPVASTTPVFPPVASTTPVFPPVASTAQVFPPPVVSTTPVFPPPVASTAPVFPPPVASTAPVFPPVASTAPVFPPVASSASVFPPVAAASTSGFSGPVLPPGPSSTPPSAKGAGNTFRRQNQKRPVYAPIPGFSSTPVSVQGTDSPYYSPPVHEHQPVATSSVNPLPPSLFTPAPAPIPESQPPNLLVPSEITEVQTLDGTPPTLLSTVMSDVSSTNANPATLDSSATLHTFSSAPPMATEMGQSKQTPTLNAAPYRPVYHHWFHRRELEGRVMWLPFSMLDSLALEAAFVSTDLSPENMVATDGGRYDVNILRRQRSAVYWESTPSEVRRCSWFYKTTNDGKYTPYEENIAAKLEEEYKAAYEMNQWHRKIDLPNGETVVLHSPDVLVLFPQSSVLETWNQSSTASALRPRVVKRGMDEFDIDEGEPSKIDHLLFLVHGIGSVCDLKFRCVEEVVDDFRSISLQLVQSHYKSSCDQGIANRIEVLPVSWHNQLHSEETGIDKKLKSITLESIPRLRDFTNDTLLDILFYTSPIYSQTIISTVGTELNRIYTLFKQRNPGFKGSVSLGGHSLGSLILFDILCHQHPEKDDEKNVDEDGEMPLRQKPHPNRRLSRRISYMMGAVGTGQPQLYYPHLNFQPIAFFALGSPIGMFVTVRGLESLGEHFALPTCPGFFNIFHPYDPVAYRVESLINPELAKYRPVLIPHHKGRKRMHLELKETVGRIGADLKQRIIDSMKSTWNSVYQIAMFHRSDKTIEAEVEKVIREQERASEENDRFQNESVEDVDPSEVCFGILNNGRRIDHVLQEAPFEFFNEYIFALTSHVCYWESEDTMLLILKEIYNSMGINPDSQIPQQTMTIERSSPSPVPDSGPRSMQMSDPMRPLLYGGQGPPPTAGFIRKT